jgi:hypothetical protein
MTHANTLIGAAVLLIASLSSGLARDVNPALCVESALWPQANATAKISDPYVFDALNQISAFYPYSRSIRVVIDPEPAVTPSDYIPRAAKCSDTIPTLLFKRQFIEDMQTSDPGGNAYWKWLFIFTHEYAHVVLNHAKLSEICAPLNGNKPNPKCPKESSSEFRRQLEMEADFWAAFVLGKMGATLEETTGAVLSMQIVTQPSDYDHPPYSERVEVIKRGQKKAGQPGYMQAGTPEALDGFEVLSNTDLTENDLYSFAAVSSASCAASCLKATNCAAFSFDRWNRFCYLKNGRKDPETKKPVGFAKTDTSLVFEMSSVSGLLKNFSYAPAPEEPKCFATETRRRFYDKAALAFSLNILQPGQSCRSRCLEDSSCNAWQVTGGECQFFESVSGQYATNDNHSELGYRTKRSCSSIQR